MQNEVTTVPELVNPLLGFDRTMQHKWLLTFFKMTVLPWRGLKS